MKTQRTTVYTMVTKCSSCDLALNSYPVFAGSDFYDSETYIGLSTQMVYILSLEQTSAKYGSISVEEALAPAALAEGGRSNLVHIPEELTCPFCGKQSVKSFGGRADVTHEIDAVRLPLGE